MKPFACLFDLDGTLIDPKLGITNSFIYALNRFGLTAEPDELLHIIGPPLRHSFSRGYGFDSVKTEEAVRLYREYFSQKGIYENTLYPGISSILEELHSSGVKIALATSKVREYAIEILRYHSILRFFDFVSGSEMDGSRSEKNEVITFALDNLNVSDLSGVVMIGDRCYDITGATQAGISSIGVLYGYGSESELAGADNIVGTVSELAVFLRTYCK